MNSKDRILALGQFPPSWEGKTVILFEPHYDDAILSCYGVLMGMLKRKAVNRPKELIVVSASHSEANYQPGTRLVLGKKDTRIVRLLELGFPDIVNDRVFKDKFRKAYSSDYQDADDTILYEYYGENGDLLYSLLETLVKVEASKNNILLLSPLAAKYSHPFHRVLGAIATQIARDGKFNLWYYRDNPYARQNNGKHFPNPWRIVLGNNDVAMRYSLFVTNYDKQVTSQCLWYDYWMLDEPTDYLYEVLP